MLRLDIEKKRIHTHQKDTKLGPLIQKRFTHSCS